MEAQSIRCSN